MGFHKRLYTARALSSPGYPAAWLRPPGVMAAPGRPTLVGVAGREPPPGGFPADDSPPWDEPPPRRKVAILPPEAPSRPLVTHLEGSRPVGPRPATGHGRRPLRGQKTFHFGG
jgi:hypothetical protein